MTINSPMEKTLFLPFRVKIALNSAKWYFNCLRTYPLLTHYLLNAPDIPENMTDGQLVKKDFFVLRTLVPNRYREL